MTPELIAILAVGVAVAGLILNGQNQTNRRIDALEQRLEGRIDSLGAANISLRATGQSEIRPAGSPTSSPGTAGRSARGCAGRTA